MLTIPAAAIVGGAIYGVSSVFGEDSAIGPILVSLIAAGASLWLFINRVRRGPTLTTADA